MSRVTAMTSILAFKLLVESFDVLGGGGGRMGGENVWNLVWGFPLQQVLSNHNCS